MLDKRYYWLVIATGNYAIEWFCILPSRSAILGLQYEQCYSLVSQSESRYFYVQAIDIICKCNVTNGELQVLDKLLIRKYKTTS